MRVWGGVLAMALCSATGCFKSINTSIPDGGTGGIDGADGSGRDGGTDGSAASDGRVPGDAGPDSAKCDGAAPPVAPTLRRPMRGAYTGSLHAPAAIGTLRPTLSWAAVSPTCGTTVTYEVQADDSCTPGALDACTFPSPELDAKDITALTYAPTADLKVATTPPVGAFYAWRVRACDAGACGPWSEVRYLHVGRVREDINGDGYGDLLATSNRGIEVYLGSSQFDPSAPTFTIPFTQYMPPCFLGDVNGDGYGDFFGTTTYTPSSGPAPTIYYGGPSVTAPTTLVLTKTAGGPSTLLQTTSAGDLNGDGFADLIVQWAYGITTPQTELRVFFGGTTIANTPDLSIPGPYVNYYTLQHSGRVGDLNGDGFEDIALTALSDEGTSGGVVQFFAGGLHPTPAAVNVATTAATYWVEAVGDVDGDGFDDALIVLAETNYSLYRGAAKLPTAVAMTWSDATTASAVGSFDLDRDGFSDFVIGTNAYASILYHGSAASPSRVTNGLSHLTSSRVVAFSDHDGDGRPDFVGMDNSTSEASIQWAGSDGTTDPRAFIVRLPLDAMFSGQLVR